ncbi:hypothetical protein [Sorangium sp. So ce1000]|uniref:hypothetical protein n=1 Tax=Sorangium sp. So ce1000 TaxID=3133325 RepID=UPI003F628D39
MIGQVQSVAVSANIEVWFVPEARIVSSGLAVPVPVDALAADRINGLVAVAEQRGRIVIAFLLRERVRRCGHMLAETGILGGGAARGEEERCGDSR